MSLHRFRFTKDLDVQAAGPDDAKQILKKMCAEQPSIQLTKELERGAVSYLGEAEVRDIDAEDRARAQPLVDGRDGLVLMSCQFRGENFTGIFQQRDLAAGKVALVPLALIMKEDKVGCLTDVMGDKPIILEKEMIHEQEE